MHVVLDALVIAGAYILSWFVTIKSSWFDTGGVLPDWFYMGALLVLVPLYLLLYTIFQLFTPKRVQGRRQEFANICKANLIGFLISGLLLYLTGKNPYLREFSRKLVIVFCAVNVTAETIERNLIRIFLRSMRAKGYNQKHILLIGYSRAAENYIDRVLANPEWDIRFTASSMITRREGANTGALKSSVRSAI